VDPPPVDPAHAPSRYIRESGAADIGSWRATIYIDDLRVVVPEHEVDAGVGADLQRKVDACYKAHFLGVKTAKNIDLMNVFSYGVHRYGASQHGYTGVHACVAVGQVHREGSESVGGVPSCRRHLVRLPASTLPGPSNDCWEAGRGSFCSIGRLFLGCSRLTTSSSMRCRGVARR
jgi:hypothetical protein